MSSGRENKLTGQIAEHLVCAELGRRGFIATPFAGNVPTFDIIVADSECRTIPIQVKATRGNNWTSQATDWMEIHFDKVNKRQNFIGPRLMANKLSQDEMATVQELVINHSYEMLALITVLEKKGILTRQELIEVIQELHATQN